MFGIYSRNSAFLPVDAFGRGKRLGHRRLAEQLSRRNFRAGRKQSSLGGSTLVEGVEGCGNERPGLLLLGQVAFSGAGQQSRPFRVGQLILRLLDLHTAKLLQLT
ncbi:hypothetical protein SDC9_60076 [bioreactor metagenome]|uniref:Uncharacterized protein n=1 Tax=bioreactor metagenome TaxID=1076179 RepID=A0A644XCV0_9ZZZZ